MWFSIQLVWKGVKSRTSAFSGVKSRTLRQSATFYPQWITVRFVSKPRGKKSGSKKSGIKSRAAKSRVTLKFNWCALLFDKGYNLYNFQTVLYSQWSWLVKGDRCEYLNSYFLTCWLATLHCITVPLMTCNVAFGWLGYHIAPEWPMPKCHILIGQNEAKSCWVFRHWAFR